jgi:hypothetical protein
MVTIQYQESVPCLAFALYLLGAINGGVDSVLAGGVEMMAESTLYDPPNPEDYRVAVDGRCQYEGYIGGVQINGLTDFKRGAPWAKNCKIVGEAFEICASYLERAKSLVINGVDRRFDAKNDSYENVL